MFDIGFPELLLVAIVALLVLGPERLPEALRGMGLWLGRLRRSFLAVKTELEKEIGMDEVRRQLHNESVMEEMKRIEREVKGAPARNGEEPPPASQTETKTKTETTSTTQQSKNPPDTTAGSPDRDPD